MKIKNYLVSASLLCCTLFSVNVMAEEHWQLLSSDSLVAYGSIKADKVGEINKFNAIEGGVTKDGMATVTIDLASVDTNVDIRNQRMIKYVFGDSAKAVLTANLDMEAIEALAVGGSTMLEVEGVLSFLGKQVDVDTNFYVSKLSDSKILATSDSMIMIPTEELGINAGIDKLMEIAKLPSITRVTPISLRFVFEMID